MYVTLTLVNAPIQYNTIPQLFHQLSCSPFFFSFFGGAGGGGMLLLRSISVSAGFIMCMAARVFFVIIISVIFISFALGGNHTLALPYCYVVYYSIYIYTKHLFYMVYFVYYYLYRAVFSLPPGLDLSSQ